MRTAIATCALGALASCNAILGNSDFKGPSDTCSGIGCMVVDCTSRGQPPTSLSGTVSFPDGALPIYNAMVYVPTAPLDPLVDGPASPACASGAPVVHTLTDVAGHFKLDNVPSVAQLPLVIQVGKWRREITIESVNECADLVLPASDTRLPRNSSEGHLPRIAMSTGAADTLECIGRSVGISDGEFTAGTGAGRVHLYAGPGGLDQLPGGAAMEPVDALYGRMTQYDMMVFGCDGQPIMRPAAVQDALKRYVDGGGWVWLSHFHLNWVAPPTPFPAFAMFNATAMTPPSPIMSRIDTSTPKGQAFADWMSRVGASPQPGLLEIMDSRNTCLSVDSTMAQRLVYLDPAVSDGFSGIQLLSWPTSGGGRLLFSDIHLQQSAPATQFPMECTAAPLSPQGKSIAFQLFDQPTCLP